MTAVLYIKTMFLGTRIACAPLLSVRWNIVLV